MGARGPAPTPTKILEARGSKLAKKRTGEPRPPVKAPGCPDWLSTEAKAEWRRQVKHLEAMGIVAEIDRSMLAAYCEAWGEFVDAAKAITELVKADKKGGLACAIAAGLINVKNRAAERLKAIAKEFGFTPSARTRLKSPEPEQTADPFEVFLSGRAVEN